jgi:hypothetical protein
MLLPHLLPLFYIGIGREGRREGKDNGKDRKRGGRRKGYRKRKWR